MKYCLQNNKKALLLLILFFLLSGCSSLRSIDQKAGEIFFNEEHIASSSKKDLKVEVPLDSQNLSQEVKEKIDNWLKENNLNRYGDKVDTYYMGGTPLFNESTGESIERFEYIFKKIPDILERIK